MLSRSCRSWKQRPISHRYSHNNHNTWGTKLFFVFFELLFGCPMANFEPLLRGKPHSHDVNHCISYFQPEGHWELRNKVGSLGPAECLVGFELGTFQFLLQCKIVLFCYFPFFSMSHNLWSEKLWFTTHTAKKLTRSWWRLKHLCAEPPSIS